MPKSKYALTMQVPVNVRAVSLSTSRKGKHVLVNYQDRVVRVFEILKQGPEERKQYSLPELRQHIASMQVCSFICHTYS